MQSLKRKIAIDCFDGNNRFILGPAHNNDELTDNHVGGVEIAGNLTNIYFGSIKTTGPFTSLTGTNINSRVEFVSNDSISVDGSIHSGGLCSAKYGITVSGDLRASEASASVVNVLGDCFITTKISSGGLMNLGSVTASDLYSRDNLVIDRSANLTGDATSDSDFRLGGDLFAKSVKAVNLNVQGGVMLDNDMIILQDLVVEKNINVGGTVRVGRKAIIGGDIVNTYIEGDDIRCAGKTRTN